MVRPQTIYRVRESMRLRPTIVSYSLVSTFGPLSGSRLFLFASVAGMIAIAIDRKFGR